MPRQPPAREVAHRGQAGDAHGGDGVEAPDGAGGQQNAAVAGLRRGLESRKQSRIGKGADRNDQAIDPAAQHGLAVLGHGRLAGHLGDQRRAESDEIVERFHDLDSGESGARLAAAARAGERADD